jgi:hypothetical protein
MPTSWHDGDHLAFARVEAFVAAGGMARGPEDTAYYLQMGNAWR